MFSDISLRDLFISALRTSIVFIKVVLRSFSCASAMLAYAGPAGRVDWALVETYSSDCHCAFMLVCRYLGRKIIVLGADVWSCVCWVSVLFLGFCFLNGS